MQIKILDKNLKECLPGQTGELFVSGPYIFSGYFGRDGKHVSKNGFNTGDLGYKDEEGYIYLQGRKDQVFKCAGKKVSTYPIYEALNKLALFTDFVILPIEHDFLGLVPSVVFSAEDSFVFKKGEILAKLRKELPSNHIPRRFFKMDKIPRTGSGKPIYNLIRHFVETQIQLELTES